MTRDEFYDELRDVGARMAELAMEAESQGFDGYVSAFSMTPKYLRGGTAVPEGTHSASITFRDEAGSLDGLYSKDGGRTWETW